MMETPAAIRSARHEDAKHSAIAAARSLADARCDDILVIDVREISQVTDFIVIASGTSDRQMRTAIDKAEEAIKELDQDVFRFVRDPSSTWLVLDYVDVVIHVFEPATRAHYDLEMLWGDGPRVDWQPDETSPTDTP